MVWINVLNLFLFFSTGAQQRLFMVGTRICVCDNCQYCIVLLIVALYLGNPTLLYFFLVSKSPFFFSNRRSNVLWNNAKPPIPKFLLQGFIRFEIVCITAADLELA